MTFFLFPRFFRSRKSFQLLPITWPVRVTLKMKVTSWSTWLLLSLLVLVLPRWIFFLFRKVFRSLNSFQLLPIAWLLLRDLETEGHVWSTWLLLSLLVLVLPRWIFFCFVRFLGPWIHSNYCQLRDFYAWPWNWRSCHGLRDFFISARISPTAWPEITNVT